MTWSEIKKENEGVRDDEEIGSIQCENGGERTFHKVRLGKILKRGKRLSRESAERCRRLCDLTGRAWISRSWVKHKRHNIESS
jgi:hypothetical protein